MKQIRNILFLFAGLSALFLTGCVREDIPESECKVVLLQMNVGSRAMTKAPAENSEDALHTVRAYAFFGDELIGHKYMDLDGTTNLSNFLMDIKMVSLASQTIDLYVIANEAAMKTPGAEKPLTGDMKRADLEGYYFTETITGITATGMPMGYKGSVTLDDMTASDIAGEANYPNEPEHWGHQVLRQKIQVDLVRPVTKFKLFAAKAEGLTEDVVITGVKRLAIGGRDRNYLFPQDEATLKAVGHAKPDRSYALVGGVTSLKIEKTLAASSADTTQYQSVTPIYYPFESPWGNGGSWDTPGDERGRVYEISYTVGSATKVGIVYMPVAERNTYYAVNCLIGAEGGMTILYTVAPWESTPEWNLDYQYPSYTSFFPLNHSGAAGETVYEEAKIDVNADREFVVKFKIDKPENGVWDVRTDIVNTTETVMDYHDFEVKVYQNDVENTGTLYTSAEDYHIHVILSEDFDTKNVGAAIKLGISFSAAWATEGYVPLMINKGSDTDVLWPDSGTDTRWLEIKIVQE